LRAFVDLNLKLRDNHTKLNSIKYHIFFIESLQMILSVDFISRKEAEAKTFNMRHVVISIADPHLEPAKIEQPAKLLRMGFKDVTNNDLPSVQNNALFTEQHAEEIAQFVEGVHQDDSPYQLVVHCQAGVCRSASVALFVEAITGCDFPNRGQAAFANLWVLDTLGKSRDLEIELPMPNFSTGGILLF
jgi:predicted protein tyrosine phosphatase